MPTRLVLCAYACALALLLPGIPSPALATPAVLALAGPSAQPPPHEAAVSGADAARTGRHQHPFTFDDMVHLLRVGDPQLSPDGSQVAYVVTTADADKNTTASALYIVPTAGGPARQLTYPRGPVRDTSPRFAPDGHRLAFVSNRDGTQQVYLLDLRGGEARKLTNLPGGASDPLWFPDGSALLVQSGVFPDCPALPEGDECNRRHGEAADAGPSKARVIERLFYRHWDTWFDGRHTHLIRVPADGNASDGNARTVADLTPSESDVPPIARAGEQPYVISPDGKELAFVENRDKEQALSTNNDIFLMALSDPGHGPRHRARDITEDNHATDSTPRYSPDGRYLAYVAQKRPGFEADRSVLWLYDRRSGKRQPLTDAFDANVNEPVWSADSQRIYFTTVLAGRYRIYSLTLLPGPTPSGVTASPASELASLQAEGLQVQVGPDKKTDAALIFRSSSFTHAHEIYRLPLTGDGHAAAPPTALTSETAAVMGLVQLGKPADLWGKTADNQPLHSFLITPPGFDPSRRYPAVVYIHGGPQGSWEDQWHYRWNPQVLAGAGYIVLMVNPRGSEGFGQRFVDEVSGDWGGRAYDDIMRATDQLVALPYVDGKRVAAMGASYGGYMVDWIAGHTDRFAALITHDGVYDIRSMQGETEELWFTHWEFGGEPWNSEQYEKWNPAHYAGNFKTPMLVVTSERDFRVPVGQGMQLFTALQLRHVPSKMLIFPDENHWVLKPGNSRLWHATVLDWLHRYLGGAPGDARALRTAAVYAK